MRNKNFGAFCAAVLPFFNLIVRMLPVQSKYVLKIQQFQLAGCIEAYVVTGGILVGDYYTWNFEDFSGNTEDA